MNLTPALYPLVIERGTKVTHAFIAKESATGPVIDLTGTTFEGQVRRAYTGNGAVMIELVVEVTDPTAGAFEFTLDDTTFELIPAELTTGVYDILWNTTDGSKPKLLRGPVTVNGTATRQP